MDDEHTIARGNGAEREFKYLDEAFDKVRAVIIDELVNTSPTQADKILKLHLAVQNLTAVRQALIAISVEGQVAKHALALANLT